MKLGFLLIVGVFFNMMMFSIFPYAFLGDDPEILQGESLGYKFQDSEYFNDKYTESVNNYQNLSNDQTLNELSSNEGGLVSGVLDGVSSFFDGLLDSLDKIKQYLSFIIPFATLFFILPGALGQILGTLYSVSVAYAVIRFIRGA